MLENGGISRRRIKGVAYTSFTNRKCQTELDRIGCTFLVMGVKCMIGDNPISHPPARNDAYRLAGGRRYYFLLYRANHETISFLPSFFRLILPALSTRNFTRPLN